MSSVHNDQRSLLGCSLQNGSIAPHKPGSSKTDWWLLTVSNPLPAGLAALPFITRSNRVLRRMVRRLLYQHIITVHSTPTMQLLIYRSIVAPTLSFFVRSRFCSAYAIHLLLDVSTLSTLIDVKRLVFLPKLIPYLIPAGLLNWTKGVVTARHTKRRTTCSNHWNLHVALNTAIIFEI